MTDLKVVRIETATDHDECLESWDRNAKDIREFLDENATSGFAVVAYAKSGRREVRTLCAYHAAEALDAFVLPDMAAEKIRQRRDEG